MRIENKDLVLRDVNKKDCETLERWWNDGEVMAHAGFPNGLGTNCEEIWESVSKDEDFLRRRLMIEYKNELIGEMSYTFIDDHCADLGIKICEKEYQNMGLGRVALSMLINRLFEMGCLKIVLDTNLNNMRARHVYELLGFEKVRVNYDSWKDQMGNFQSSVDYELYRERFNDFS